MVRYSNGGLKPGLKKPVYGPKCLAFKWSAKSGGFTIWIPDIHTVHNDESGIQVFGIQMVTVYSVDLKSGLVWILNGHKQVGLQMVQIFNGIWNLEAQPFEI